MVICYTHSTEVMFYFEDKKTEAEEEFMTLSKVTELANALDWILTQLEVWLHGTQSVPQKGPCLFNALLLAFLKF